MTQDFLNSFFFHLPKFRFENPQEDFKFSLEERWGNAYIEIIQYHKLPLEFKFRVADHAITVQKERPFEALIAFGMATMTAKELWDVTNTEKFSTLAISVAEEIIRNEDEIDELFEWL